MLEYLRRRREDDQGFTLIELMVVVLIIAILIAIAIPTFLGAQDRARDRAAQSELRTALTAAKTISTDFEGNFQTGSPCGASTALDAAALFQEEASLSYIDGAANAPSDGSQIGVTTNTTNCQELTLTRASTSGNWFCVGANQDGTVGYGKDTAVGAVSTYANCDTEDEW